MRKTKTPQKEDLEQVSHRDNFQTPNYATDLIVPFLADLVPMSPGRRFRIWECAAGQGKMLTRLEHWDFDVFGSDLQWTPPVNFLTDPSPIEFDCIVTNTPYSSKKKFYERCKTHGVPFALLIPADYAGWIIDAIEKDGCEKIIPTRRIDYITPNILRRIWEGETWEIIKREQDLDSPLITKEMYVDSYPMEWQQSMIEQEAFRFESIYDAPVHLLRKYSSSDFHSMWLTWGFNIGKTETFVELTNEMKNNI